MLEVGKTREGRFLIVFLLQFLTFSAFLAYHEVTAIPTDAITTMLTILMGMAPLGFVSAVNTVVAVEGVEMLAERYLRRRYEAGLKEGRKKEKAEGLKRGKHGKSGIIPERRLAAESAGEPVQRTPPGTESPQVTFAVCPVEIC